MSSNLAGKSLSTTQVIKNLSEEEQDELLRKFWPHIVSLASSDCYTELLLFIGNTLNQTGIRNLPIKSFQDLFTTVEVLKNNATSTHLEIIELLKLKSCFESSADIDIQNSIALTVRLWLGVNVCFSKTIREGIYPGRTTVTWEGNQILENIPIFPDTNTRLDTSAELDMLTAINLKRFCRLEFEWANCLNDHLRLSGPRGRRVLHVYQHKKILIDHEDAESPFKTGLIDEIVRSLNLLFPWGDLATKSMLEAAGKKGVMWVDARKRGSALTLDDFDDLRPRIKRLLDLFNGPPEGFRHALFDRRDTGQIVAVWAAIIGVVLTIGLGIVASVFTIKQYIVAAQAYDISVRSFDISLKAYDLSLKMACEQNATMLGRLCY
ncbi:hypothetical protein B0J11DRAFT_592685 [Dendryphion nanum]|uniref:Uncharacterized protein n=1 Tax=Dendryphion nanum TaxID=256645 RepID=A0A9P9IEB3_9PLEO|nr:hypothetical protein B0J11DRAFT_592685 [Dendryphion nanum]